jgi:hypothetical protein
MDEAGTSWNEPVTVVVGVVMKPDNDWIKARAELKKVMNRVPQKHREGMIFHAKEIWGNKKYRDGWSREERFALICDMLALPRKLGMTVIMACHRKDAKQKRLIDKYKIKMSLAQWHHYRAFGDCLEAADCYVRERCGQEEIATVVYEDITEMRKHLENALKMGRMPNFQLSKKLLRPTLEEQRTGVIAQRPRSGVSKIQDTIQFADKESSPMLQLADACAFAFRRFLSHQERGVDLVAAMGVNMIAEDWAGPSSSGVFSKDPILRNERLGFDPENRWF